MKPRRQRQPVLFQAEQSDDMVSFFERVAENAPGALGRDGERLAQIIIDRLDRVPGAVLRRRDHAIVDLLENHFADSTAPADDLAADLRRYAGTGWRRDRRVGGAPERAGPKRELMFAVLSESKGRVLGERQLQRILVSHCSGERSQRHPKRIPMSPGPAQLAGTNHRTGDRRLLVTAKTQSGIIALLEASPLGHQLVSDAQTATVAARQRILDELDQIDDGVEDVFRPLDAAVVAAKERLAIARKELEAAGAEVVRAESARYGASVDVSSRRNRLEASLRNPEADAVIDSFLLDLHSLFQDTRLGFRAIETRVTHKVTGKSSTAAYHNGSAVRDRLGAIRRAMDEAEKMRFVADQSNMPTRLKALFDVLQPLPPPPVLAMEEVQTK